MSITTRSAGAGVVLALVAASLAGLARASAQNGATFVVKNTNDAGKGSLRAAIQAANASAGKDTITFAIPGDGTHAIALTEPLPTIAQPVVIDGQSQPGFSGMPVVQLDDMIGVGAVALDVKAGGSTIRSLSIGGFGKAIVLRKGDGNTLVGNWLGFSHANDVGIEVATGSAGNTIGGTTTADRNVVSASDSTGILLAGSANVVSGNYIGGSFVLPGNFDGIDVGGSGNTIGGTAAGAGNLISGNKYFGVSIYGESATGNVVAGNVIGTGSDGTFALPNGSDGVEIWSGASGNTIGGTELGDRNVISGNHGAGVVIKFAGTSHNRVLGNRIGTNANGAAAIPNGRGGVWISQGATDNAIGGSDPGSGNLISGNKASGVLVEDDGTTGNVVAGNFVGPNAAGTASLKNAFDGVEIDNGASGNIVGGTTPQARNVISGNSAKSPYGAGVDLRSGGNAVFGNYIGTDKGGSAALPNRLGVVVASGVHGGDVGGGATGARNVISGNLEQGIWLAGIGVDVQNNLVGTDATGAAAVPNQVGIDVEGGNTNNIGGRAPGTGNVVSGNTVAGIDLVDTTANYLWGNLIGTSAAGTAGLPNTIGISVYGGSTANHIGDVLAASGNVVSGNTQWGIYVYGSGTTNNLIRGNLVGLDVPRNGSLPNGVGIKLWGGASGNHVGGTEDGAGNTIAGNKQHGVVVDGATPTAGDTIERNSIFSNGGPGIRLLNGGNHGQAAPSISSVQTAGGTTTVKLHLGSFAASTTFRVELFANPVCDVSGAGEGEGFVAGQQATTNGAGAADLTLSVSEVPAGQAVTATATNVLTGDTSQFSACAATP